MQTYKGIYRRVDELGRVVIPRELRELLRIQTGTMLEFGIFEESFLVLRKYNKLQNIKTFLSSCCNLFSNNFNIKFLIFDNEKIIFYSKDIFENIKELESIRKKILSKQLKNGIIYFDYTLSIYDIIDRGDNLGYLVMFSKNEENIKKYGDIVINLISNYFEI